MAGSEKNVAVDRNIWQGSLRKQYRIIFAAAKRRTFGRYKKVRAGGSFKNLRKYDMNSIIIFTTAYPAYVFEAYEYISFHYLLKPISEDALKITLLKAEKYLQKSHRIFQYTFNKVSYSIADENIIYFYQHGRKAYIHTNSDVKECNMRIEDILSKLNPHTFAQVSRSYIVNLRYVEMSQRNFVLVSNRKISIGATYQKDFVDKYHNYVHKLG